MRALLLTTLCLAAGPAIADEPFVPPGVTPPDYEVSMVTTSAGKANDTRLVLHHGAWTRDALAAGSPRTAYYRDNGAIGVSDYGSRIQFRRGVVHSPGMDEEPRNTGERQTRLGENCTVWETMRSAKKQPGNLGFSALSCVTDDGIELWQRSGSATSIYGSAEATRIERRPVAPEEVRPPRDLLALDWWDHGVAANPSKPDYESSMEQVADGSKSGPPAVRTMRRAGPWRFKQEVTGTRTVVEIFRDGTQLGLSYQSDESGNPAHLMISRPYPESGKAASPSPPRKIEPVAMDRHETILGEQCQWFDMMPGSTNWNLSACLTDDKIVLAESSVGLGYVLGRLHFAWTATRLTRRPIPIDEIRLPAELLMPRTWGLD